MPDPDNLPPYYPSTPPEPPPTPSNKVVAARTLDQLDEILRVFEESTDTSELNEARLEAFDDACMAIARAGTAVDQYAHSLLDLRRFRVRGGDS